VKSHKDLDVWRLGVDLACNIYEVTKSFPKEEQYGIANQMRRSATSIPSNIAEGAARHSSKEFVQFLHVALGSASELDTQLEIAIRVNLLADVATLQTLQESTGRINQMLRGLAKSVRQD
jgi:four helix bundle protein